MESIVKPLITFALGAMMCVAGSAQQKEQIVCPIDGTHFEIPVTDDFSSFTLSKDLEKCGGVGYYYLTMICTCPTCRYSGYHDDFGGPFSQRACNEINQIMAPYKDAPLTNALKCEVAAQIGAYFKDSYDRQANVYLVGSYLLRGDDSLQNKRVDFQRRCAELLIKAAEAKEYTTPSEYATTYYLIGELSRRTGDFARAIKYFDLVLKGGDPTMKSMAAEQKKLAEAKDDDNGI